MQKQLGFERLDEQRFGSKVCPFKIQTKSAIGHSEKDCKLYNQNDNQTDDAIP